VLAGLSQRGVVGVSETDHSAQPASAPSMLGAGEGYALWAPTYDESGGVMRYATQPFIDEMCSSVEGTRVLDLGCGTGRLSRLLQARGASVLGIDPCFEMLSRARQESHGDFHPAFAQGRGEAIPCPGGQFDLVLSCLVLDHILDLNATFLEVARVLAFGGRVVVGGPHASFQIYVSQHPTFQAGGRRFSIFSHVHFLESYFHSATRAGLTLSDLREPAITADVVAHFPLLGPLRGAPLAVVMELRKLGPAFPLRSRSATAVPSSRS